MKLFPRKSERSGRAAGVTGRARGSGRGEGQRGGTRRGRGEGQRAAALPERGGIEVAFRKEEEETQVQNSEYENEGVGVAGKGVEGKKISPGRGPGGTGRFRGTCLQGYLKGTRYSYVSTTRCAVVHCIPAVLKDVVFLHRPARAVSGDPAALAACPSRYSGEPEVPLGLVLTDTYCLNSAAGSSG
ncbi:hypothetical protein Q9966_006772 [Columba livia]|nr:hypothetical protein Q9966_006772 [Columba livia]